MLFDLDKFRHSQREWDPYGRVFYFYHALVANTLGFSIPVLILLGNKFAIQC